MEKKIIKKYNNFIIFSFLQVDKFNYSLKFSPNLLFFNLIGGDFDLRF